MACTARLYRRRDAKDMLGDVLLQVSCSYGQRTTSFADPGMVSAAKNKELVSANIPTYVFNIKTFRIYLELKQNTRLSVKRSVKSNGFHACAGMTVGATG